MLNRGITLGLWQGIPSWVVVGAWIIILGCFLLSLRAGKKRELTELLAMILILVGGGANLMMRITQGAVWDGWRFGTLGYNNWADYLIFFGVVLYGYTYFVRRLRDRRPG